MRFLEVDKNNLKRTTYNFSSFSTSPQQWENEIRKLIPTFKPVIYEPDFRQGIAQSWPAMIDCESMKKEVGITFDYDFETTLKQLIKDVKETL